MSLLRSMEIGKYIMVHGSPTKRFMSPFSQDKFSLRKGSVFENYSNTKRVLQ